MTWVSYLWPVTLLKTSSRYNRDIRVIEQSGIRLLTVNGVRQSGKSIGDKLDGALKEFGFWYAPTGCRKALILGIGGGTIIGLLREHFPGICIDAVDIDKKIIEIAKKYFRLPVSDRLILYPEDAQDFISEAAGSGSTYDFIFVDVYIGYRAPEFVSTAAFLESLHRLLNPDGTLFINYTTYREFHAKSDLLLDKLGKIFQSVKSREIGYNRFFYAQQKG